MTGPFVVGIGLFLLYVAVKGKSASFLNAAGLNNLASNVNTSLAGEMKQLIWDPLGTAIHNALPGFLGGGGGGGGGHASSGGSSGGTDIGTHMGLDTSGNVITINSSYGNMTPTEQDQANAFARANPNGL